MSDVKTEQLNILMESIRDIVKAKTCPDWVARKLTEAVKRAKTFNGETANGTSNFSEYKVDYEYRPFNIGDNVISNINGDNCLYNIIGQHDPVNGVNLYTVKIIKGNANNPPGHIAYNVPETMLQHIKEGN